MERLTNVCCVLLLVIALLFETTRASSGIEKAEVEDDTDLRTVKFDGGWGVRNGKRKRITQKLEDFYRNPSLEREQLTDFIDSVDNQWTILALRGDKRDFTPRLGRESGEDTAPYSGEKWYQLSSTDSMVQRSAPPFPPRFGRSHLYTPRPGKK